MRKGHTQNWSRDGWMRLLNRAAHPTITYSQSELRYFETSIRLGASRCRPSTDSQQSPSHLEHVLELVRGLDTESFERILSGKFPPSGVDIENLPSPNQHQILEDLDLAEANTTRTWTPRLGTAAGDAVLWMKRVLGEEFAQDVFEQIQGDMFDLKDTPKNRFALAHKFATCLVLEAYFRTQDLFSRAWRSLTS